MVFSADHWMEVVSSVMYECWTLLSALAGVTPTIRLGSAVTPIPLYHAPALAKRVATVDHISGRRAILSAGCVEDVLKRFRVPTTTERDKFSGLDRDGLASYGVDMPRGISDFDSVAVVGTHEEIISKLEIF